MKDFHTKTSLSSQMLSYACILDHYLRFNRLSLIFFVNILGCFSAVNLCWLKCKANIKVLAILNNKTTISTIALIPQLSKQNT